MEILNSKPASVEIHGPGLQATLEEIKRRGGWCPRMEQGSNCARWKLTIVWEELKQEELL